MRKCSRILSTDFGCIVAILRHLIRFPGREDRLGPPGYEYGGARRSSLPFKALLVSLLLSITTIAAFGQSPFDEKEEAFLFTARAFGDDYFENIQFYDAEDVLTTVSFDPYSRTAVHRLPANRSEATFIRFTVDERGEEQEETVAIAELEGIESRAFLVFVSRRDRERNLPYTVYVADESPGKFEAGHLRLLNLAGPPILARIGSETVSLGYGFGGDRQFVVENIEEVPFEFAVRVANAWKIVYSTGFRAHPEVGTLAILKPPRTLGSLEIQVELSQRRYYFDPPELIERAVGE